MRPEADKIMSVFKERNLKAGELIQQSDFGEAIEWQDGNVKDEPTRAALRDLFDQGLLVEHSAAFELSPKGAEYLYGAD